MGQGPDGLSPALPATGRVFTTPSRSGGKPCRTGIGGWLASWPMRIGLSVVVVTALWWGLDCWLDQTLLTAPDGRTLQWVLRSQLGSGPLALLALRGFTLPDQIFSVDSAAMAQALMTNTENSDMDGVE